MLRLAIAPATIPAPPLPSPHDPHTEVWRDHDGTVCALGNIVDGHCWLHLPGVASFRFGAELPEVTALPTSSAPREQVVDAYYRTVLPFALQARGLEVLHASAVRMPPGVVALCALKETGKSTIAYALGQRGHPLWADDAVVFSAARGRAGIDALSVPFAVRLRPASSAYFGRARGAGVAEGRDGTLPIELAPAPFAAAVVMERADDLPGDGPVAVERLESAAAFTAVLTHGYCFTLREPAWKQRTVSHYLDLVRQVPVFRVRFRTGLEHLPAIMDAIERAVGVAAAAPAAAGPAPARA